MVPAVFKGVDLEKGWHCSEISLRQTPSVLAKGVHIKGVHLKES